MQKSKKNMFIIDVPVLATHTIIQLQVWERKATFYVL